MKKFLSFMMACIVALSLGADTFSYLNFTLSDGITKQVSTDGLTITYAGSNVVATTSTGTTTLAKANVTSMYFTNTKIDVTTPSFDLNHDGYVDVADVAYLIDVALGGSKDIYGECDLNGDGYVDVADVSFLINYILQR
ncbi:MAG: dockerin type I repeat-containing protein [Muribaculaceae bacterium]|nr:dockerin type I repeat-containing protein [Muribaculaceae bacterium]